MRRTPEPEVMDDPAQARAYALADFAEPHQAFIRHFRRCFPGHRPQRVLDLGCGAADVTLRFARAFAPRRIVGVDASAPMLVHGHAAVTGAGQSRRIRLLHAHLPLSRQHASLPGAAFDTVISNSLLHHLAAPQVLWEAVRRYAAPRAAVFAMDLVRPGTRAQAEQLVERYAAAEAPILQRDFVQSLLAAYRLPEIKAQLRRAGLADFKAQLVSDHVPHVIVYGMIGGVIRGVIGRAIGGRHRRRV